VYILGMNRFSKHLPLAWRSLALTAFTLAVSLTGAAAALPFGVPAPRFGYTNEAPQFPQPWNAQVHGFYFVNGAMGSDAGNNTNGTPAAPRRTIPSVLPPGACVVITNTYGGGDLRWRFSGTPSNPIYIRGFDSNSAPAIRGDVYFGGSNVIFEYLRILDVDGDRSGGYGGFFFFDVVSERAALRHCEISGNLGWGGVSVGQFSFTRPHSDILIWNNNIHHNGNVLATTDQDRHGIVVSGATNVWVIDNTLAYNSGDGIQINGGTVPAIATNTHHIFVVRNHMHHNKQAGGWSKQASDVVFAYNVVHDHWPGNSSPGAGLGFQYAPERVWFIGNSISNCSFGFYIGGDHGPINGTNAYFINNVLQGITNYAWAITGSRNHHLINNTVAGSRGGVYCPYRFNLRSVNNVFETTSHVYDVVGPQPGEFRNNIYSKPGSSAFSAKWNSVTYGSLAPWQSATGKDQSSLVSLPGFVSSLDLRLANNSPGHDTGLAPQSQAQNVYAHYAALYGASIMVDRLGMTRPQGGAWDIGAYEGSGTVSSPRRLRVAGD
jgi:hypothetical protein